MIEVYQPMDIDILLVDVFNPLMLEGLYMYCPLINGVYTQIALEVLVDQGISLACIFPPHRVVDIIDPSAKTFGLMGSNLAGAKDREGKAAAEEEELSLQKGSYVFIHSGRQRGTYGVVSFVS